MITEFIKPIGEKALEYFARANDIQYFPEDDAKSDWWNLDLTDPENWSAVVFYIRVTAYSGIASGQLFRVSFGDQTFEPVNNHSPPTPAEDSDSDTDDDNDFERQLDEAILELEKKEEEDDPELDELLFELERNWGAIDDDISESESSSVSSSGDESEEEETDDRERDLCALHNNPPSLTDVKVTHHS